MYNVMSSLATQAVIVCATSNLARIPGPRGGLRPFVDTIPALFAQVGMPNVIAVSNCDNFGVKTRDAQRLRPAGRGYLPQVFAPGIKIRCANAKSATDSHLDSGTSFCKLRLHGSCNKAD